MFFAGCVDKVTLNGSRKYHELFSREAFFNEERSVISKEFEEFYDTGRDIWVGGKFSMVFAPNYPKKDSGRSRASHL